MDDKDIYVTLAEHEEKLKSANHRITNLEEVTKKIESITLDVHSMALSLNQLTTELIEQKELQQDFSIRLREVEAKPERDKAKKHDDTWQYVWHIVLGGVVGIVLTMAFMALGLPV